MDPNYANAGGGGSVIGGSATAVAAAAAVSSARYNAAFYKDPLVSCQRSIHPPYNNYDPYVGNSKVSSAYPFDAEAEFKERTGMGKTKIMAGSVTATNSVKVQHQQHAYNPNSCYGGSYNQSNAPEGANYYAYAYEQQQQQQQQHHHYTQQQQQYHHQNQLQQQYKFNKLVAAQHQQQQHHQHLQQQKISPPEYGYASYHHPYYHPHYHHPSTQKGVAGIKTIPDASSSMPYVNSKMMTARAPQYPSSYTSYHHPQSSYPPVVTAGHQHTYQSQSVCDDSRWIWNSSTANEYPNSSCRSASYSAYVNGSAVAAGATAKQQHNTIWPPHSMPMQYQSTGYPAATALAPNQSCCPPPPPNQSSTTAYYPQQYVKYPMHQSAVDYNNDLYGNSTQGSSTVATVSGKVYTDLSGNSYQQAINNPVAFHHQQQQQQPGEYSASHSSTLDYNSARYLQQHQQQTDSPSSLSSASSSSSSYNHHYYHPYSNVEAHQETYQQQVDTKIKSQSLRDFLTTWNEDEDEMNATEVPFMEQLHLTSDHFAQDNTGPAPIMENHLQFKGSFSSTSRPKIHVGITVDSTVEPDQYINLPDIIIDIEKSNKDVVTLPEGCQPPNKLKLEKDDVLIKKEEMPNIKDELEHPKKEPNQIQKERKLLHRKFRTSKHLRQQQKQKLTQRNHRKSKIIRRKIIRRRVKKPTLSSATPSPKYNPQSLKCLCVTLINSEKFRKSILGPRSEINSFKNTNITTTTTDNDVNIDAVAAVRSSSSVIPKLSDLCKNALNSSFDRDVLVINLDEILDSDNLFVVQCDINENILENFVEETETETEQHQQQQENSRSVNNNANAEDLVEILNDNNNNYNNSSSCSGNSSSNIRDISAPFSTNIEQLKRCCSVTEVSNLPLDNAVRHNNFNLTSTNSLIHHTPPPPGPPTPPSPAAGSLSCPATLTFDGRGHDRSHSGSFSSLIEQNCLTQQQISIGHNDNNNKQLHEMLMLSGIQQTDVNKDNTTISPTTTALDDDCELLLESSKVVTTPFIHHEEIVPDNLKKFQNEKFLKYLHAKYVQGNLSEFYHANRIIKKYKKRIIKKLLNIVR